MSNAERWCDWEVVHSLENPGKTITAVVDRNLHFGTEGFKPIIRVYLLQNDKTFQVVWESGEASKPSLSWKNETELVISYEHNLTVNYKPNVVIEGIEYLTTLDMNIEKLPHFTHSWGRGWFWKNAEILNNPGGSVTAILEIGENDITKSTPIARVLLSGDEQEQIEVWSSGATTVAARPVLRWSETNTLLISVNEYHSYTFFPAKRIGGEIISIEIQKQE